MIVMAMVQMLKMVVMAKVMAIKEMAMGLGMVAIPWIALHLLNARNY